MVAPKQAIYVYSAYLNGIYVIKHICAVGICIFTLTELNNKAFTSHSSKFEQITGTL